MSNTRCGGAMLCLQSVVQEQSGLTEAKSLHTITNRRTACRTTIHDDRAKRRVIRQPLSHLVRAVIWAAPAPKADCSSLIDLGGIHHPFVQLGDIAERFIWHSEASYR